MSKQSLVQTRVKRAQPILERIRRAAVALHLGALERLASSSDSSDSSDRENFGELQVMLTVGSQLVDHIARDLAALAVVIGDPVAPVPAPPAANVIAFDPAQRRKGGAR
jgi:hypothetical protein